MDASQQSSQLLNSYCYFCREVQLRDCLTRSLYHKYNDATDKSLEQIDTIISQSKDKVPIRLKFDEMLFVIDDSESMTRYNSEQRTRNQMTQLLEYYKYRRFVPVFVKSKGSKLVIDSVYCYYYERLKLYYNGIKKNLNMTIDESSKTEQSESFISNSQRISTDSYVLGDLASKGSKQTIRQYQTESKALESLVTILKQNQERLKRIKTLKTEDCTGENPYFGDARQRKSSGISQLQNMISSKDVKSFFKKKKSNPVFYKYLDEVKSQKSSEAHFKFKLNRKSIQNLKNQSQNSSKNYVYQYTHNTSRSKKTEETNIQKERKNLSKSRSKRKISGEKSHRKIEERNLQQKDRNQVKSLPKTGIQFQIRPSRSVSTISLKMTNKINKMSSGALPKQDPNYLSPYQTAKIQNGPRKTLDSHSNKKLAKNTVTIQIEQTDNIASVRRKKLEQLKIKSNKKKKEVKGR